MKLVAVLFCITTSAFAAERPNILFIYVEDLGYYTGERSRREPKQPSRIRSYLKLQLSFN
ncbi:MAG: hypothetical protein FJ280_21800 [Planctomycetes bacterium]|nr:hypothetical protein [Planctomycetota bacterium]